MKHHTSVKESVEVKPCSCIKISGCFSLPPKLPQSQVLFFLKGNSALPKRETKTRHESCKAMGTWSTMSKCVTSSRWCPQNIHCWKNWQENGLEMGQEEWMQLTHWLSSSNHFTDSVVLWWLHYSWWKYLFTLFFIIAN